MKDDEIIKPRTVELLEAAPHLGLRSSGPLSTTAYPNEYIFMYIR